MGTGDCERSRCWEATGAELACANRLHLVVGLGMVYTQGRGEAASAVKFSFLETWRYVRKRAHPRGDSLLLRAQAALYTPLGGANASDVFCSCKVAGYSVASPILGT